MGERAGPASGSALLNLTNNDLLYRAASATALIAAPLDAFTAVFHRASGITHLLSEPAPEILAALAETPLRAEALMGRLAADYDIADADREALTARLDELVAAGLVEAVAGAA